MATQRRERGRTAVHKKMGHHRSHSEAIEGEVMKINTGIITVLKIKIENGTFVMSIFKWLRYIDQAQPRFFFFLLCNLSDKGKVGDFSHLKGSERKKISQTSQQSTK